MARGKRKAKACEPSSNNNKSKNDEESEDSKKVSVTTEETVAQGEGSEGVVWDLVRTLTGKEGSKHTCSNEPCANAVVAAWASNENPTELWYTCEECQEKEFGGWPDDSESNDHEGNGDQESESESEPNTKSTNDETTKDDGCPSSPTVVNPTMEASSSPPTEGVIKKAEVEDPVEISDEDDVTQVPVASKSDSDNGSHAGDDTKASNADVEVEEATEEEKPQDDQEDVEEEGYDLAAILSEERIMSSEAPLCSVCEKTRACVRYEGTTTKKQWFYCLDCQQADYEGWPETAPEYPSVPTMEHESTMLKYCCKDARKIDRIDRDVVGMGTNNPSLPKPNASSPQMHSVTSTNNSTLTPPPPFQLAKTTTKKAPTVTPCNVSHDSNNNVAHEKKKVVSATAQKAHAKWLAEAQKVGGPQAKLILDRPEVKRLVFDVLRDAFGPKNINDIYEVRILPRTSFSSLTWRCHDSWALVYPFFSLFLFSPLGSRSSCTSSNSTKLFG